MLFSKATTFCCPTARRCEFGKRSGLTPEDWKRRFLDAREGALVKLNDGGGVTVLSGHFQLAGPQAEMLIGMLPPIVHRQRRSIASLRWAFDDAAGDGRCASRESSCYSEDARALASRPTLRGYAEILPGCRFPSCRSLSHTLGLIQSVPADGQVTVGRPSDVHVHPIAAQPWTGLTILTGAWHGILDLGVE